MMTPLQILDKLEGLGYRVRTVNGKLRVAPKPDPGSDVDTLNKQHRDTLVAVLEGRCPRCGSRLKFFVRAERYAYLECGADPVDYMELVNRTGGQPMGVFTDYDPDGNCTRCGAMVETFNAVCEACHVKAEAVKTLVG